jgi:hypothetical protein
MNGQKLCENGAMPASTTLFAFVPRTSNSPSSGLVQVMPSFEVATQVTSVSEPSRPAVGLPR